MRVRRVCTRRSAAGVSLRPPLPPRVKGVRSAQVTTMSEGDWARMASRPRGMSASEAERWDWTCERRCWAGGRVVSMEEWVVRVGGWLYLST